ncbi:hypothetical protein [Bacillus cereus]
MKKAHRIGVRKASQGGEYIWMQSPLLRFALYSWLLWELLT